MQEKKPFQLNSMEDHGILPPQREKKEEFKYNKDCFDPRDKSNYSNNSKVMNGTVLTIGNVTRSKSSIMREAVKDYRTHSKSRGRSS